MRESLGEFVLTKALKITACCQLYVLYPGTAHFPGHLKGTIVSPALLNDQFCRNGLLTTEPLSEVGVAAKHRAWNGGRQWIYRG